MGPRCDDVDKETQNINSHSPQTISPPLPKSHPHLPQNTFIWRYPEPSFFYFLLSVLYLLRFGRLPSASLAISSGLLHRGISSGSLRAQRGNLKMFSPPTRLSWLGGYLSMRIFPHLANYLNCSLVPLYHDEMRQFTLPAP